ncbi:restriction endonuclease subunit S [Prevotella intermedia]|uniref:restriction endonuclease subunit S n=1 Tax=Prevotella intermedia TaxID=28131 RepID=UPI0012FE7D3D|nr:restriction endonuclease subunit S [Prevotella intermedia]
MKLSEIATFVEDKVSSNSISLADYVTTDSLLPNKEGKALATNLPPVICSLTHFRKGDVLVANIRPYLKKVWLADKEGGCSSDVLVFRVKEGNKSSFLYAIMLQDRFFDYAMKGAKGSKMPRGDKDQIMRYELPTFSPQEQENIGNLVISITNKLWLNRSINHNLEAMAKQLYDYWFMQFDFPDENGKPYKSSGGAMVYNENLKRNIPEGWNDGIFADIANITMGQSPDGSSYNETGKGEIFYQGSTDFGIRFPSVRMYTTSPTRYAKQGDILMSVRAPVGAVNIANSDCCIGRGLSAINSMIGSITYIYYVVHYLKVRFDNLNTAGTTFGSITKDELFNLPVVVPSNDVIERFEVICKPIFNKQMEIGFEIESLDKQRNELLPLLMNGQASLNYDLSHD